MHSLNLLLKFFFHLRIKNLWQKTETQETEQNLSSSRYLSSARYLSRSRYLIVPDICLVPDKNDNFSVIVCQFQLFNLKATVMNLVDGILSKMREQSLKYLFIYLCKIPSRHYGRRLVVYSNLNKKNIISSIYLFILKYIFLWIFSGNFHKNSRIG